ncbi:putative excises uracil residues from the DNA which can arise as a result of misincorporation of dUMP residues by DNA polymerase or due to deamination of cytosine [Lyophyllum shimeji]|uniref:Uracil-DNA glycosylase n=1 Tax=Lyophyllum shimeji TaxID=47721 RepID=A0A9P3PGL1_LYOSH|nr:putative excises uracil residues from the DNA which can arise as a result of misincorporation of dUMP residues by DNA polymerase or due to deamination of cytosine [Lyophyllum shimeji]
MPKDISKPSEHNYMSLSTTLQASGLKACLVTTTGAVKVKRSQARYSTFNRSKHVKETTTSLLPAAALPDIKERIESLEKDTMESSWYNALETEFEKPYFRKLKIFLAEEHRSNTVYPPLNDVYSWSTLTPLDKVKVVILGQDPYHNAGQAHGLSFSVLPPTKPPGSLKNIYKQLTLDYPEFIPPTSGDLSPIAKLGVLWLNTSLTVRAHKAASHANKGWEIFTAQVIRTVIERESGTSRGIVFMAWGLPAQKTCAKIGIDEEKHLVLKSPHPSPLSAHRGFIGNGHFRRANAWLKERYGEDAQIDWTILSGNR